MNSEAHEEDLSVCNEMIAEDSIEDIEVPEEDCCENGGTLEEKPPPWLVFPVPIDWQLLSARTLDDPPHHGLSYRRLMDSGDPELPYFDDVDLQRNSERNSLLERFHCVVPT